MDTNATNPAGLTTIIKNGAFKMFNRKHILLGDMSTETLWEAYCAAYYKLYQRFPKYSSTLSRHYLISKTAALRAKGTLKNASKSM